MLTTVEKVLFLKGVSIFSEIPGEVLSQIAQIAEEVGVDRGTRVFEEGEPGDSLYLIVRGSVRVHKGEREVAVLGKGECFGEMAILDNEPRSASITALEDVQLLRIWSDDFYEMLADRVEIARGIFKVLTRRLRQAIGR